MVSSGYLVPREYKDFRGIDLNEGKVLSQRSPFSLNMWKNYDTDNRCIETRPDIELYDTFDNNVYGIFFFEKNNQTHTIVHCGTKLYDDGEEIFTGMNVIPSKAFVYNNLLYIKDGINYLKYDGTTVKSVDGYVPTTSIGRKPSGGGTAYQDVNLLTGLRKNSFVADGESKEYYLDAEDIDSDYALIVTVDGDLLTEGIDFEVDEQKGKVTFNTAPAKPVTEGQDNVYITYRKTIQGYRDRVLKCTLLTEFDNRVFFSGNVNFPNVVFHTSLEDPEYVSDLDYYEEGVNTSKVKDMVAGNNALWVFKEPNQENTTIFYHTPVIDSTYGKVYPSSHSSIALGCVSKALNFNDDIVFFSDRGLEGISGDINSEQVLGHRSTLIDNGLLSNPNYKNPVLVEWKGYLLVILGNKIYLADSRQQYQNDNSLEYEWYYWEFSGDISAACVKDGKLYLAIDKKMYTLTKTEGIRIKSSWQLAKEDFDAPQFLKTTNKRGGTAVCEGTLKVRVRTDNNQFEEINTYTSTKGYIVYRIKRKKFKEIQVEFSSTSFMKLYSCTLEAFVGGYVKR